MRADGVVFGAALLLVCCACVFFFVAQPVERGRGDSDSEGRGLSDGGGPGGEVGCQVLVAGAGVGGLYVGYRLAPRLRGRLCVVDDRTLVGGKVQSVPVPDSSDVSAPTCAEQLRDIDVQLRCLCRELDVRVFVRGEVSLMYRNYTTPLPGQPRQQRPPEEAAEEESAKYVVEGGPQRLLLKMAARMRAYGVRFWSREKVVRLDKWGGGGFEAATASGIRFKAERVVLAMPPGAFVRHIREGRLAERLRRAKQLRAVQKAQDAAVLNLYMRRAFWWSALQPDGTWHNTTVAPQFMSWTVEYDGGMLQFIATPDRVRANMLRLFLAPQLAKSSLALFRRGGADAVAKRELRKISRLRQFAGADLATAGTLFHYEEWAYARLAPDAKVTAEEVADWAAEAEDKLCFASEGFSIVHKGWMGGAVDSATRCLRGALREYFADDEMDAWWSTCLSVADCQNECVALDNEIDMRDIATGGLFAAHCRLQMNKTKSA